MPRNLSSHCVERENGCWNRIDAARGQVLMNVWRADFATENPALAEDLIRQTYVDQHLSLSRGGERFTFANHAVGVTGPGALTISRMHHTLTMRFVAEPFDDTIAADAVTSGSVEVSDCPGFDGVRVGPGEVFLGPPDGHRSYLEDADQTVTLLSHSQVAEHAAARTGVDARSLRFTGLSAVDRAAGRRWLATVAHVRDDILAEAEVAAIPMVLQSAFGLLATTLLASFPNTVLDAIDDPLARAPGEVGDSTVDRVVDHLQQHAAEPLGPADVAELAGAPARDIDDALRRRRNTTLAEQLWRARMQGAYRDLYDGDAATGDTVAAIAARWGFTNPATFTVAYALSTGGETPDDTLRR